MNYVKPTVLLAIATAIFVYARKVIRDAFPDDVAEAAAGEVVPDAPDSDTQAIEKFQLDEFPQRCPECDQTMDVMIHPDGRSARVGCSSCAMYVEYRRGAS